jgi:hypothetical protein
MRGIWNTMVERWRNAMPGFFKVVMRICILVGGTATAIHIGFRELGITPDAWWDDISRYLIGGSIGGAFVAKFTMKKGNVDVPHITDYDKEQNLEN